MAKSSKLNDLPYNGILHEPRQKTSDVVFIFIHHYGGNNKSLKRHIMMANHFGYSAISFELEGAHNQKIFFPPISKSKKWGLRYIWADRIEDVLKLVPQEKIIFSLSNPSFAVLDAVARLNSKNIKGIIFDGGPFFDIYKCYWNLFTHIYKYKLPNRVLQMILGAIYWNAFCYKSHARKYIKVIGNKVPVLSIRAIQDKLVPVESIDKCLASYPKDNLTQVLVDDVEHLMGIKSKKEFYYNTVKKFISQLN